MCDKTCLENIAGQSRNIPLITFFRPGGELMPGEDENEGLKRAMTEVTWTSSYYITHISIHTLFHFNGNWLLAKRRAPSLHG